MEDSAQYDYIKYNDFWQNNLQKLEEITGSLEKNLFSLEKKYVDFDNVYDNIISEINVLTSIYSSLNNIKGREYLFKLKAIINNYKSNYTHEGIDFKTIHFLNSRISSFREASFNQFPELQHSTYLYKDISIENDREALSDVLENKKNKKSAKYKWVTFFRCGSWFLTGFKTIQILDCAEADVSEDNGNFMLNISQEENIPIEDIFASYPNKKEFKYIIVTEKNKIRRAFAAERTGRIIMASKNIMPDKLKPFRKKYKSPGRVRAFGRNHIYIK